MSLTVVEIFFNRLIELDLGGLGYSNRIKIYSRLIFKCALKE